jgi:hypothetical protein
MAYGLLRSSPLWRSRSAGSDSLSQPATRGIVRWPCRRRRDRVRAAFGVVVRIDDIAVRERDHIHTLVERRGRGRRRVRDACERRRRVQVHEVDRCMLKRVLRFARRRERPQVAVGVAREARRAHAAGAIGRGDRAEPPGVGKVERRDLPDLLIMLRSSSRSISDVKNSASNCYASSCPGRRLKNPSRAFSAAFLVINCRRLSSSSCPSANVWIVLKHSDCRIRFSSISNILS